MADREQIRQCLRAMDLSDVALTAEIDDEGNLRPIGDLDAKLIAATDGATPDWLRSTERNPSWTDRGSSPCRRSRPRFRRGCWNQPPFRCGCCGRSTFPGAVERLYEEHGPLRGRARALSRHLRRPRPTGQERPRSAGVALPGVTPPAQVQRERLPRDAGAGVRPVTTSPAPPPMGPRSSVGKSRFGMSRSPTTAYSGGALRRLPPRGSEGRGYRPRFVVLGPPGSGKTTLEQALAYRAATGALWISRRRLLPIRRGFAIGRPGPSSRATRKRFCPSTWPIVIRIFHRPRHRTSGGNWLLPRRRPAPPRPGRDRRERRIPGCAEVRAGGLQDLLDGSPTCRSVSFDRHQSVCRELPVFVLAGLDDARRDSLYPGLSQFRSPAVRRREADRTTEPATGDAAGGNPLLSILASWWTTRRGAGPARDARRAVRSGSGKAVDSL